jgi:hypothetical protein
VDVFAHHYELHYQNKKIHLEGSETISLYHLDGYLFMHHGLVIA